MIEKLANVLMVSI
ncbi:hypothetical protein CFP56_011781 [Quercus suber]|uniref:Uncharacterized protein n=1 Tax=Quercus suber TaxID=58331 RepID=A0AAW0KX08_QUESU